MHHLRELERSRVKILYNLGPEEIAKKEAQPFIMKIPVSVNFADSIEELEEQKKKKKPKSLSKSRYPTLNSTTSRKSPNLDKKSTLLTSLSTSLVKGLKKLPHQNTQDSKLTSADLSISFLNRTGKARPMQFQSYSLTNTGLWDQGCITCGKDNFAVKFHGQRHVCVNCRKYIKTINNDRALIYLDNDNQVQCKGLKTVRENGKEKKVMYDVPLDQLKIFEYRCYVSFSAKDELIVLLHDEQYHAHANRSHHDRGGDRTASPAGTPMKISQVFSPVESRDLTYYKGFSAITNTLTTIQTPALQ
jgi:hypothetical protein